MNKEFHLPAGVAEVLLKLEAAGFEARLVGGCVRDWYMGIPPHDYDITTSALPEEVLAVFAGERVLETGLQHGTVTVLTGDGPVEVTTYRLDGDYTDHRHPESVTFTRSLREDLARRDFTMNAMAMDAGGGICDPFGGRADIDAGRIRCVGEADRRFEEDALRILRGLRFAARLGFAIEAETGAAMHRKKERLNAIARERVFAELCGLLLGGHCAGVLREQIEVLQAVLPEIDAIGPVERVPAELPLRWAALLLECGPEPLARLKAPTALRQEVKMLIAESSLVCPAERISVRQRCAALGYEGFLKLLQLQQAKAPERAEYFDRLRAITKALIKEGACLSLRELAVSGRDLMTLGLRGPAIGRVQKALLAQVVAEQLPNERAALLQAAERMQK